MKIIKALLIFCLLLTSLFASADNFFGLKKYSNPQDLPQVFYDLGGGESFIKRIYIDDDGIERDDKIFYTIVRKFKSKLSAQEIRNILDPSNNKISKLFDEATVKKSKKQGAFKAFMNIDTPLKTFVCQSTLNFSSNSDNVFYYRFSDFNMVFTDMIIQIELEERESFTKVTLLQVSALKGVTHQKLKKVFSVDKFEQAMRENVEKFKNGISGK